MRAGSSYACQGFPASLVDQSCLRLVDLFLHSVLLLFLLFVQPMDVTVFSSSLLVSVHASDDTVVGLAAIVIEHLTVHSLLG